MQSGCSHFYYFFTVNEIVVLLCLSCLWFDTRMPVFYSWLLRIETPQKNETIVAQLQIAKPPFRALKQKCAKCIWYQTA